MTPSGYSNHEVMDLVQRADRMKPPNSSTPGPMYALMLRCWQSVPDMRPSFSEIIRSIGLCLVDPDVLKTPLPIFSGSTAGYSYDEQAIMRPPPDSTDYLVPSHTCSNSASNYSVATEKTELLSPDSCSISQAEEGRLVELDESIGGITVMNSRVPPPLPFSIRPVSSGGNCIITTTSPTPNSVNRHDLIVNTNLIDSNKSNVQGNCASIIIDTTTTRPSNMSPYVRSDINRLFTSSSSAPKMVTTTAISTPTTITTPSTSGVDGNNKNNSNSSIDQLNASALIPPNSPNSSFMDNHSINTVINVNTSPSNSNRKPSPTEYVNI